MQAKRLIGAQKQRQRKNSGQFDKGNPYAFKPGQSGNPGGLPTGTPKMKVAYLKLLALSPDELVKFKPATVAEDLAFKQVKRAHQWEYADNPFS